MTTSAAEAIFARHHRDLHRYVLRMTGRDDVADDVCQEAFLRIVRAIQNGGAIGHERGWVFAIARNLMADGRRARQSRPESATPSSEPAAEPAQALAYGLREALARLSDTDRDAFLLKEIGGLSYAEIAIVCSCSLESVRSRLFRTRMQLRAELDGLR